MRNRKDSHFRAKDLIQHRVREVSEVVVPGAIAIFGPVHCRDGQAIDGVEQLHPERVRSYRASVEIPEECLARLRCGQDFNIEGTHRELRCRRTSAQGTARTRPALNSARRRFTSTRHSSETVASSAVSRLSSRATAKAERSSTGRARTSSRRWFTRAFMRFSLAPRVPREKRSTDNISIDTDPQLQEAASPPHVLWSGHLGRSTADTTRSVAGTCIQQLMMFLLE